MPHSRACGEGYLCLPPQTGVDARDPCLSSSTLEETKQAMQKHTVPSVLSAVLVMLGSIGVCFGQCPLKTNAVDTGEPSPTISPAGVGDPYVKGEVLKNGKPVTGTVQVCVNATPAGPPQPVGADGSFSAAPAAALKAADIITAQYSTGVAGANPSDVSSFTVPDPNCSAAAKPTISLTVNPDGSYTGSIPGATGGYITICDKNEPVPGAPGTAPVKAGSFSGSGLTVSADSNFVAEYSSSAKGGPPYTNSSAPEKVSLVVGNSASPKTFDPVAPLGVAAVGLDVAGASSTSPAAVFLATGIMDVPVIGTSQHNQNGSTDYGYTNTWWLSGYLRIAGMAQPGNLTQSVGDLASTGTYLASAVNATPDKIVQSIEADATAAYQFGSWRPQVGSFDVGTFVPTGDRSKPDTLFTLSVIVSIGAITPLSASQANPPVYYLTQQIMNTYNISPPGCAYTSGATPPCYVAFVPSDRTHFYRDYEGGLRMKLYGGDYTGSQAQYRFPGMADVTIGQNEYVTGGRLHGAVLHIGGSMPVPAADGIYIFGAMDLGMNFKYNQENPQLLLTPVPSSAGVTYLSPTVNTIPVSQPNRDRYRIGFGVNIFDIISAMKAKSAAAKAAAPPS